jgi:2-hydroxychromene-2-carboxylate isomerase
VLAELVAQCALPARCAEEARSPAVQERYESYTRQALDANVFGAPSYVLDGEVFWGQDRLEFLERALKQPTH